MKKVISIVLNNFTHDNRVLKENVSLQKAGYDVLIVALHEEPLLELDLVQNIPVHRMKLKTRKWSKNKFIQIIKYFEFNYRVIKEYKHSDILHCNDLTALPIGFLIKQFFNKNVKIVYDAHEYETETNGSHGIQKSLKKILEKFLIKYADKVITVSDTIANEYQRLYSIPKPSLVLNAPPYQSIEKKDIFRRTLNISKDKIIFIYQGGLMYGRGVELILNTFQNIDNDKLVIVFMGFGPLEHTIINSTKQYKNIYFQKAVSSEVILDYTSSADYGISGQVTSDHCLSYYYSLPNKVFEYTMAELPIIVSNAFEMKKFVKNNNIGVISKENNVLSLKRAIQDIVKLNKDELLENLQKVKEVYNWEEQEKILLKVYKELSNVK